MGAPIIPIPQNPIFMTSLRALWRARGSPGSTLARFGLRGPPPVGRPAEPAPEVNLQEHPDHGAIELAPRSELQPPDRLADRERGAVRTGGGHRIERVTHEDDPGFERDLGPGETVRIPLAVPPLVAGPDDRADLP